MEAVRIEITAYTASFRLPGMMGYQACSPVPPPSTIIGMISAAVGEDIDPHSLEWMAYYLTYESRATDLEKIIVFSQKGPFYDPKLGAVNSLPISREYLYLPKLVLYLPTGKYEECFAKPRYPLLLGRSQDVACVESIRRVNLENVESADIIGTLLPFPYQISVPHSMIAGLPTYMQLTTPRTPGCVRMFHIVDKEQKVKGPGLYSESKDEYAVYLLNKDLLINPGA